MAESLLAHLYSRIRGSQEDVATLSLHYIISSNNVLNEAFNRLLSESLKLDIGKDISYSCQSVGENSERPDMSGVNSEGKESVLCEMKFYAGLTFNQPNGYLNRLIEEKGNALVFICPEQRKASLWTKVKELCKEYGRKLTEETGYRVLADGIAMTVISWAEVIETLRRTASTLAVDTLPDIAQLDGFCKMMDSTAFIPFAAEDLGPEIARKEERYFQVIDRLYDVLIGNDKINPSGKGLKASPNRSGYIRYIKIGDYQVALIYNRTAWMNNSSAETPFWFYVNDEEWKQSDSLKAKLKAIPEYERDIYANNIIIALYALLDSPLDEIANNMMNQIINTINALKG